MQTLQIVCKMLESTISLKLSFMRTVQTVNQKVFVVYQLHQNHLRESLWKNCRNKNYTAKCQL